MSRLPDRSRRAPARLRRYLPALPAILLVTVAGCTSDSGIKSSSDTAGSAGESSDPDFVGPPTRVTWTLFKTGQRIVLVNETDTDRLEFYSESRESASTKVQTDEIVAALIEFFDDEGFEDYATAGSAPAAAIGQTSQALEVVINGRPSYMLWSADRPEGERDCFVNCRNGLAEIWNATYAAQAVENMSGEALFATPQQKGKRNR